MVYLWSSSSSSNNAQVTVSQDSQYNTNFTSGKDSQDHITNYKHKGWQAGKRPKHKYINYCILSNNLAGMKRRSGDAILARLGLQKMSQSQVSVLSWTENRRSWSHLSFVPQCLYILLNVLDALTANVALQLSKFYKERYYYSFYRLIFNDTTSLSKLAPVCYM